MKLWVRHAGQQNTSTLLVGFKAYHFKSHFSHGHKSSKSPVNVLVRGSLTKLLNRETNISPERQLTGKLPNITCISEFTLQFKHLHVFAVEIFGCFSIIRMIVSKDDFVA